jgi:5'-phosphate synthase pdxT subunit
MLSKVEGITPVEVKTLEGINSVDRLIIPGGESTTIAKLLKIFGLFEPLKKRIQDGMPVWGTCAGMILLANEIVGEEAHLQCMDITVKRNAYGSQLDSFSCDEVIPEFSDKPLPLVFIRAPYIEKVGEKAKVLCELNGHIVCAKQDNVLVTSFHPELTQDYTIHEYFCNM